MTKKDSALNISEKQHQTLLGLLVGDAHLELAENGKSARLKLEYSKEKLPYVEHLHEVFKSWDPGSIRDAPGKKKDNKAFSSKYSTSLLEYHRRFYSGEKRIPQDIGENFTDLSLAYLYMDDGGIKSKQSKAVFINTYCFPKDQQEAFALFLKEKFKLEAKVVLDRGYDRIFISGESF